MTKDGTDVVELAREAMGRVPNKLSVGSEAVARVR
jgi:hypothetical protein